MIAAGQIPLSTVENITTQQPLSSVASVPYAARMTPTVDDSALMLRYQDGDTAAFEILYRRHNDALLRYLLRLCQHRATAEDVFQDVWGKIIKSRDNYRPTAKFTTFMYRVAHNCFIDNVRRNKRHSKQSPLDADSLGDPAEQPDVIAERKLARERLERALTDLPDEQRDVFLLHEEGGLNLDEIALVTNSNRETAKSRLRYAVSKLTKAIDEPARSTA